MTTAGPDHVTGGLAGARGVDLWWQGWRPAAPPRGVLLLAHGLGEHSGRYAGVVDVLGPDGWAVYGLDHRGHGRSGGRRAHLDDYRDWIDDFHGFRRHIAARHPEVPLFLLGHSMGGQIALAYALEHGTGMAGLVLSAPLLASRAVPVPLVTLLKPLARIAPTARVTGIDVERISKDPAVVADYRADPMVHHGHPTLALGAALFGAMAPLTSRVGELAMPLLLQHGTDDALTDPAGSRRLEAGAGSSDLTVHWYPGLWHEIYHEPERDRPLADLRRWLAEHR